jgi:hypothetical protein
MVIQNNVIKIDLPTYYSMRQCREAWKWCEAQKDPIYDIEAKGEKAIYSILMKEVMGRA